MGLSFNEEVELKIEDWMKALKLYQFWHMRHFPSQIPNHRKGIPVSDLQLALSNWVLSLVDIEFENLAFLIKSTTWVTSLQAACNF